jgi:hypothetical protein
MRCTACNRTLNIPPLTVAGYPYGPVCFERAFPSVRINHAPVVIDEKTIDLFAECYFDAQGEADRLAMIDRQG